MHKGDCLICKKEVHGIQARPCEENKWSKMWTIPGHCYDCSSTDFEWIAVIYNTDGTEEHIALAAATPNGALHQVEQMSKYYKLKLANAKCVDNNKEEVLRD